MLVHAPWKRFFPDTANFEQNEKVSSGQDFSPGILIVNNYKGAI